MKISFSKTEILVYSRRLVWCSRHISGATHKADGDSQVCQGLIHEWLWTGGWTGYQNCLLQAQRSTILKHELGAIFKSVFTPILIYGREIRVMTEHAIANTSDRNAVTRRNRRISTPRYSAWFGDPVPFLWACGKYATGKTCNTWFNDSPKEAGQWGQLIISFNSLDLTSCLEGLQLHALDRHSILRPPDQDFPD